MALTNEEIIEALKEKTLIELAELRDLICETFGVTATAAVAVASDWTPAGPDWQPQSAHSSRRR